MAKTQKAGKRHNRGKHNRGKPKGKGRGRKQRGGKTHTQKGGGVFGFLPELTGSPNVMRHYPNISQETCEFDPLSVGVLRPSPLQLQAGGGVGYSLKPNSDFKGTYPEVVVQETGGECGCDSNTFDGYTSPLQAGGKRRKKRGKKSKANKALRRRKRRKTAK